MHELVNPSWVGVLIGLLGLVMAILGFLVAVRARKNPRVTFLSQDTVLIHDYTTHPADIEVRYQGVPVPKVTASAVWIWNSGNTTVRGDDIVPSDPIGFQFPGSALNASVRKVTRDVIGVSARISSEPSTVHFTFNFLDPGDGAIVEILHDGDAKSPTCVGTIVGLPAGLDYWSLGNRHYRWKAKSDASSWAFTGMLMVLLSLVMLAMSTMQILGVIDLPNPPAVGTLILPLVLGIGSFLFARWAWRRWRGLSVPSALDH